MNNDNPSQELVALYNPDNEDYTITYDINEDGMPLSFTLPAQTIGHIPKAVADNMVRKLANHLAMQRGWSGSNYDETFAKISKEITDMNL